MTPKELLDHIALPLAIASPRSTLETLNHLHLQAGRVTATDLTVSVRVDLSDLDPGLASAHGCVHGKRLQLALVTLPPSKPLTIRAKADKLLLECGGAKRSLPLMDPTMFSMPVWGEATKRCPDPALLARAAAFVDHAVARSDLRPYLNGVAARDGHIYGTDGFRAARIDGAAQAASLHDGVILPIAVMPHVIGIAMDASAEDGSPLLAGTTNDDDGRPRTYTLACGRTILQFQLVAGQQPPYERVMCRAHAPAQLYVTREDLAQACRGIARLSGGSAKQPGISLTVASSGGEEGSLEIELRSTEVGEEVTASVPCRQKGMAGHMLATDPRHLADALEALTGAYVTISQPAGPASAIYLTCDDPALSCVVMPMRL